MNIDEFTRIQQNRIALYRFLGRLFEKPLSQADVDALSAADISVPGCEIEGISHGLQVMSRYLRKRNTGTREVLNRDYTSAFYGVQDMDGKVAIPFQSAFEDEGQKLMGSARSKVFNIYKKQGLRLGEGVDLPEDHLSFMCQFMAVMAQRTADLHAGGKAEALQENLLLQEAFLKEHILCWFPRLSNLATQLVRERFYRGGLEVADGFFRFDAKVLKTLVNRSGARRSSFDLSWWELPRPVGKGFEARYPDVNTALCIRTNGGSCSQCASACPLRIDPCAIARGKGGAQSQCIQCGACARACPTGAVSLELVSGGAAAHP